MTFTFKSKRKWLTWEDDVVWTLYYYAGNNIVKPQHGVRSIVVGDYGFICIEVR